MKVGDLVKFKSGVYRYYEPFLVLKIARAYGNRQKVWIYPNPDAFVNEWYLDYRLEVVSESR